MKLYWLSFMTGVVCFSSFAQTTVEKKDSTDFLPKGVVLPEVETVAGANRRSDASTLDMGMLQMDKQQLLSLPSMTGEPDIIKALATQPGVSEGVEGFSGLYVRGGGNDQNLILLDGVPLYQISHLGGLFSSFNTEIVDNVTFYKSSFPAQYGGRLSSVVDIRTASPDFENYHGAASLGLTSGMVHLTGPIFKGKTAFDVSVRRSWLDVLSVPTLAIINKLKDESAAKTIARYAFTDVNARIDHRFSDRSRMYMNVYWGNDLMKFGDETEVGKDYPEGYSLERNVDNLRWGNTLASIGWWYKYNDWMTSEITASFTRYKSLYKREIISEEYQDTDNAYREDRNSVDDISLFARWKYSRSNYDFRFGGYFQHHNFLPSYGTYRTEKNQDIKDITFSDYRIFANEGGAYADFAWNPLSWLGLDAGLRYSAIHIYDRWETSLEPRFLANFRFMPNFSFKAGYARMGQYVQQVSDSYVNLPTDNWMPMGKDAGPLISDQISAGLFYDWERGYSFSLEGYYKWLDGVAEVNEDYAYGYDKMENILYGKGRVSGGEFTVTRNVGKLTGSFSYGLMWNDRKVDGINHGEWYPAKFDTRHKVNLVASYKLNDRIELNAAWVFATGNRMTVPVGLSQGFQDTGIPGWIAPSDSDDENLGLPYYTGRNNVRLPAYHRLDLGASFTRQLKKGRKGVWRVGLYNAYCRMNPIVVRTRKMVEYTPSGGNHQRPWDVTYETFSIFPIIPNVSYTYYF